jgi:hypothetical protein
LLLGIGFFGLSPIYPHHPTHLEFFIWNSSYQRLDSFELIPSHTHSGVSIFSHLSHLLWCTRIILMTSLPHQSTLTISHKTISVDRSIIVFEVKWIPMFTHYTVSNCALIALQLRNLPMMDLHIYPHFEVFHSWILTLHSLFAWLFY